MPQEKMEEDGTEPLASFSWTREERDSQEQEKMEEDGTEPRPGIIAGQGHLLPAKTGEDGGGWYRTRPGIIFWTREEGVLAKTGEDPSSLVITMMPRLGSVPSSSIFS